jgi:hypothetical protein
VPVPNEETWRAEARTFAAYLGSSRVPAGLAERYREAVTDWQIEATAFDERLARFAAVHPALTSLADSYARIVRPYGDLRRRLTLMLALLESHGSTHIRYDSANPSSRVAAWLALAASTAGWGARTLIAILILAPMHGITSLASRSGR